MPITPLYESDGDLPQIRAPRDRVLAIGGGVVAGLVGAVALWIWNGFWNVTGKGVFWPTFKGTAAPFLGGPRVMAPAFDLWAVVLGGVLHLLIGIGWGALFAALFYGLPRVITPLAGLFWGMVVWVCMFYIVLPMAGLAAVVHSTPVWRAILTHLWFGLFVGLAFLPFQRRYPRINPPEREPHRRLRRQPVT